MMVMTAKLNLKKIMLVLGAAAGLILVLILILGGTHAAPAAAPAMDSNQARVRFLEDMGWEVNREPVQSGQVRMPDQPSAVYERYNNLQKSQGYDLTDFAGKKAMRYVYELKNIQGSAGPVYATLLVRGNQIIGGDVTDTGAGGKIRGLRRSPEFSTQPSRPASNAAGETSTVPSEIPQ